LSPPLPLSSAPIKPAKPDSTGKMAVKMDRERETQQMYHYHCFDTMG